MMRLTRALFCSLALTSCLTLAANAAPGSYYGKWRIVGIAEHGDVTAISPKEAESLIGTIIIIDHGYFAFGKQRYEGALYEEKEDDRFAEDLNSDYLAGRSVIEDKSLLAIRDPVTTLYVYTSDGKVIPGAFLYTSEGRLLLSLRGYTFNLVRR